MLYLESSAFILAGIGIFLYRMYCKKALHPASLLLFLAIGAVLFYFESVQLAQLPMLLGGILIFNAIIESYGTREHSLYLLAGLAFVLAEFSLSYEYGLVLASQAILAGLLSGVERVGRKKMKRKRIVEKNVEMKRNAVQTAGGLIFILLSVFAGWPAEYAFIVLVLFLGFWLGSYATMKRKSLLNTVLSGLERRGTRLGFGAIWLAIGTFFAISFLNPYMVPVVFGAIYIADSFSTVIGVNYGTVKLPYNKDKSVLGTLSYFIVSSAIAYLFLGPVGVLVGAIAAITESLRLPIDDNMSVAVVLVATLLLI
jgi:dolichol kinase